MALMVKMSSKMILDAAEAMETFSTMSTMRMGVSQ